MESNENYYNKYLKYKFKYKKFKQLKGGANSRHFPINKITKIFKHLLSIIDDFRKATVAAQQIIFYMNQASIEKLLTDWCAYIDNSQQEINLILESFTKCITLNETLLEPLNMDELNKIKSLYNDIHTNYIQTLIECNNKILDIKMIPLTRGISNNDTYKKNLSDILNQLTPLETSIKSILDGDYKNKINLLMSLINEYNNTYLGNNSNILSDTNLEKMEHFLYSSIIDDTDNTILNFTPRTIPKENIYHGTMYIIYNKHNIKILLSNSNSNSRTLELQFDSKQYNTIFKGSNVDDIILAVKTLLSDKAKCKLKL